MLAGIAFVSVELVIEMLVYSYKALMQLWFVFGLGCSLTQTPGSRPFRHSAWTDDQLAMFATQFTLSHPCWLISYPLAG